MFKKIFNIFKKSEVSPGEFVRCIDDRNWNGTTGLILLYGKKYKVLNVIKCPGCGSFAYDIGGRFTDSELFTGCRFHTPRIELPGMGIHWAGSFRFEKCKVSKEELEKEIEEAVSEEKYEKAAVLKHLIEQL
jgi:hypothetical protein